MKHKIHVASQMGDIRQIDADVVVLKYAQELVGAAQAVAQALGKTSSDLSTRLPAVGSSCLFAGSGKIKARQALFISAVPLRSFDYADVRQFGFEAVKNLLTEAPQTQHMAMTVQGAGLGLAAAKALRAQLEGCAEAIAAGSFPPHLERISFVDQNSQYVQEFQAALSEMLPGHMIEAHVPDAAANIIATSPSEPNPPPAGEYDVFISYKSEDTEQARQVYELLQQEGLRVFFSKESLPQLGSDQYHEQIDMAIERARHLVVVTTSYEYVTSKWVQYEWRLFLGEKLAGRKSGNLITIVSGDLKINDLPITLRNREVVRLIPGEIERLVSYVKRCEAGETASPPRIAKRGPADSAPAANGASVLKTTSISDFVVCTTEFLKDTSWTAASDHARKLSASDSSVWTLPSLEQLRHVRKASLFPGDGCYWSNKVAPGDEAFYVHFDDGHIGRGPQSFRNGICAVFVKT
jgi:hypothetical protein